MILQVIVLALVLGIVLYQVVQGLFNSLIMMMLTILCTAVAFEYYEAMAQALLYETQGSCAEAASLATLFIVPLLVLRIIFDRLIVANVVMSMWVDRIAGGLVGLVTALILVGVFCTVLVKLPFGESIIGHTSHDRALAKDQGLFPMDFTLGLVNGLSKLGLSGEAPYGDRHPDLPLTAFCERNTAGKDGRLDSPTNALTVMGVYEPEYKQVPLGPGKRTGATTQPAPKKLLMPRYPKWLTDSTRQKTVIVRLSVSDQVRSEKEKDNWWRLPATHFRLVSDKGRSYYPVAYLTTLVVESITPNTPPKTKEGLWQCHPPDKDDDGRPLLADLLVQHLWFSSTGPERLVIDWVYSIPEDEKATRVVFRHVAAESIDPAAAKQAWPPKPDPKQAVFRMPGT